MNERGLREKSRRRAQVEDQHRLATLEELLGDVQADEACAAGEQDHGVTNGNNLNGLIARGRCLPIMQRKAARFAAALALGLSLSGVAYGRGGHSGPGGFHGSGGFHHFGGAHGVHHFGGPRFHSHALIGGGVVLAPFFYPPPAYYEPPPAVQYVEPSPVPSTPQPGYWYYCPGSQQYYPYAQQCPGGWQPVAPQPPS